MTLRCECPDGGDETVFGGHECAKASDPNQPVSEWPSSSPPEWRWFHRSPYQVRQYEVTLDADERTDR